MKTTHSIINTITLDSSKHSTDVEYWNSVANGAKVEPLNKPCKRCAITTDFYQEMADNLSTQPTDIQNKVMDSWDCHNSLGRRGCAGIRNFIKEKQCQHQQ
jgi:hypothetical protein